MKLSDDWTAHRALLARDKADYARVVSVHAETMAAIARAEHRHAVAKRSHRALWESVARTGVDPADDKAVSLAAARVADLYNAVQDLLPVIAAVRATAR